jgi:hypothetical protein
MRTLASELCTSRAVVGSGLALALLVGGLLVVARRDALRNGAGLVFEPRHLIIWRIGQRIVRVWSSETLEASSELKRRPALKLLDISSVRCSGSVQVLKPGLTASSHATMAHRIPFLECWRQKRTPFFDGSGP